MEQKEKQEEEMITQEHPKSAEKNKMPKLVIILGAGSSADFGIPTLRNIFKTPIAEKYLQKNTWLYDHLRKIFWEPRGINLNTSDASLTVEEMLTILRDWSNEQNMEMPISKEETELFKRQLYILIKHTLYKGRTSGKAHLNHLLNFSEKNFSQITWASFNWDCLFESSFYYWSGPPEPKGYRSNPRVVIPLKNWRHNSSKHVFLKLHGGINWWRKGNEIHYVLFSPSVGGIDSKWAEFEKNINSEEVPVILEPSYYKYGDEMYEILKPQWTEFGTRLSDADYVTIVGYSLPEADSLARSKILTSFQANQNSRWIVVDSDPTILERYKRLLGTKRLETFHNGLNAFNENFEANMKKGFPELFQTHQ